MLRALIAGAGPAGATTALLLARADVSVRIYERSVFPRTKPCGEYLSAGCVRLLHELGVGARLDRDARPVRGVRLHGHGVHAQIDFPQPGWSLPRAVLDAALLDTAVQAGASFRQGRVEGCAQHDDFVSIASRLPDGTIEREQAQMLVGADGVHSIVARKCGLAHGPRVHGRFALGGHYQGFRRFSEYIDMFVDGENYVAINPLDEGTANVMLVVDERELKAHGADVEHFAEQRARELAGAALDGTHLEGKRIAIGPLAYRADRVAGPRVMLVGDAACFLNPFTGQGVYLALRCAQLAAECIRSGDLPSYEKRAKYEITKRERAAQRVASVIASPVLSRAGAALLSRTSWMLQPLVRRVTGVA